VGASDARRLARTESNYVANQAEMDSYAECGVEKYEFVATLDARTSDVCAALDGKVFPVKEQQPGVNAPPMHPYCRSGTIAYFDDDVMEGLQRRARDPETGKTYLVPADMTYPEWKKSVEEKYGAGTVDRARQISYNGHNIRADREQYERYKAIFGKQFPRSFSAFQTLKYFNEAEWNRFKSRAHLQEKLSYEWQNQKSFIPKHTRFTRVKIIAGAGTDVPIRSVDQLIKSYGGSIDDWRKCVGNITSSQYVFDIHWYELDGVQHDIKLKNRKERSR
jgi:SPP1 gp7 family putative phage head morphogenesis protein